MKMNENKRQICHVPTADMRLSIDREWVGRKHIILSSFFSHILLLSILEVSFCHLEQTCTNGDWRKTRFSQYYSILSTGKIFNKVRRIWIRECNKHSWCVCPFPRVWLWAWMKWAVRMKSMAGKKARNYFLFEYPFVCRSHSVCFCQYADI